MIMGVAGCLRSQVTAIRDQQTSARARLVSGWGRGWTYLPPLLVLHPLSIHDAHCGERRKKGLTCHTGQEKGGPCAGGPGGAGPLGEWPGWQVGSGASSAWRMEPRTSVCLGGVPSGEGVGPFASRPEQV